MEAVNQADGYEELLKAIRSLSPKQRAAFDKLCCGNDIGLHPRTAEALMRRNLIEEYKQMTSQGGLRCFVYRYTVPIAAHMAWAAVCAEENAE